MFRGFLDFRWFRSYRGLVGFEQPRGGSSPSLPKELRFSCLGVWGLRFRFGGLGFGGLGVWGLRFRFWAGAEDVVRFGAV